MVFQWLLRLQKMIIVPGEVRFKKMFLWYGNAEEKSPLVTVCVGWRLTWISSLVWFLKSKSRQWNVCSSTQERNFGEISSRPRLQYYLNLCSFGKEILAQYKVRSKEITTLLNTKSATATFSIYPVKKWSRKIFSTVCRAHAQHIFL